MICFPYRSSSRDPWEGYQLKMKESRCNMKKISLGNEPLKKKKQKQPPFIPMLPLDLALPLASVSLFSLTVT